MRYIRTENGIYEVIKPYDPSKLLSSRTTMVKDKSMLGFTNIPNMVILKEADNIEELCDDFIGVLDNGNGSHIWYDEEYLAITEWETQEELSALKFKYAKANLSLNEILYGAIWTSKGLIYVAKMNKKGELELL